MLNINQSDLQNLNLDASAQKKIEQIVLLSKKTPVADLIELAANNTQKDVFGETELHGKDDQAFISYKLTKSAHSKHEITNEISLITEDKQYAVKGLTYFTRDTISIKNLCEKEVQLSHIKETIYFNGLNVAYTKEANFKFNKHNELEAVEVVKSSNTQSKKEQTTKTFNKKEVKELLSKASNNQDFERVL